MICSLPSRAKHDTRRSMLHYLPHLQSAWPDMQYSLAAQVRFEQPICLTGIKVGAAPSTAGPLGGPPFVHVFAADLTTLSAARFSLLTQHCTLPATGTKAVRLEVSVMPPLSV